MIKPMRPLLFMLLIFCISINTSVIAVPSIEFEKTEFDIGEVETCRTVKVTFSFKNAGDEDIEIRSLTAGCGSCTNLRAGLMKLSPGQSSTIEVDFTTPGVGGPVCQ